MKLTIKVGRMEILTTEISPTANIVITFSSRWFGWTVAMVTKDEKQSIVTTVSG